MFDITTQAVAPTATIHVKSADGEPLYADAERKLPVQIVLWGPGSAVYGVVEARQTSRVVKRMNENEGKLTALSHEDQVRETAEDLAALTVKFENLSYPPAGDAQGAELFTAVYADVTLGFIVKQCRTALKDWSVFKQKSGTS